MIPVTETGCVPLVRLAAFERSAFVYIIDAQAEVSADVSNVQNQSKNYTKCASCSVFRFAKQDQFLVRTGLFICITVHVFQGCVARTRLGLFS